MIAEESAAAKLSGMTLDGGWTVLDRLPQLPDRTAATFSVGYLVRDAKGRVAFCKALDYSAAFEADDPAEELQRLAAAYLFERDLLQQCRQRGMSRIVHAISSGRIQVADASPPTVNYLIFDKADGDSRDILDETDVEDYKLVLGLVRDCASALGQLHRGGVTHQDIKPANLLGWRQNGGWDARLADLGRAFCDSIASPHSDLSCPGDTNWAPPELLYGWPSGVPRTVRDRQLADLYSLGSLLCYTLFRVPYGGLLAMNLDRAHLWSNWQGGYTQAQSFLVEAHEKAIVRVTTALPSGLDTPVATLIADMCHPLLESRGGLARKGYPTAFLLERYITRFDLLMKSVGIYARKWSTG